MYHYIMSKMEAYLNSSMHPYGNNGTPIFQ